MLNESENLSHMCSLFVLLHLYVWIGRDVENGMLGMLKSGAYSLYEALRPKQQIWEFYVHFTVNAEV